jgi:hypothetical protein
MPPTEAIAEIFWTAFRSLNKNEQEAIVERLLRDEEFMEDLRYAVIIERRKHEPRISLNDYLAERKRKRK